jgi:hypothetical protein
MNLEFSRIIKTITTISIKKKMRKRNQLKRINSLNTLEVESKKNSQKKEYKKIQQPKWKIMRKKKFSPPHPPLINLARSTPTKEDPTTPTTEEAEVATSEALTTIVEGATSEAAKTVATGEDAVVTPRTAAEATPEATGSPAEAGAATTIESRGDPNIKWREDN